MVIIQGTTWVKIEHNKLLIPATENSLLNLFFQGNYLGKSSYKFLDVVHSFGYAYGMLSKSIEYDVTTDRWNS